MQRRYRCGSDAGIGRVILHRGRGSRLGRWRRGHCGRGRRLVRLSRLLRLLRPVQALQPRRDAALGEFLPRNAEIADHRRARHVHAQRIRLHIGADLHRTQRLAKPLGVFGAYIHAFQTRPIAARAGRSALDPACHIQRVGVTEDAQVFCGQGGGHLAAEGQGAGQRLPRTRVARVRYILRQTQMPAHHLPQ